MTRFDDILLDRARARYPQSTVEPAEPYAVRITHPDGGVATVNVAAVAWEFAEASDDVVRDRIDRQLTIDAFADVAEAVPTSRLMPLLRSTSFAYASAARGHVVTQSIDDYLCVVLGLDHADGIQLVNETDLARWQLPDVGGLFASAFANLRAQVGPQSLQYSDLGGERRVALARGVQPYGYQASLAFVGDLMRRTMAGAGSTTPVVFFPSRNDFFVVPDNRPELLTAAFEEALGIYQDHPRPLSPMPYSYDGRGLLVPWRADPRLASHVERARAHLVHGEYEAQRAYFDQDPAGLAERDQQNLAFLPVKARLTGESWAVLPRELAASGKTCLLPANVTHVGFEVDAVSEQLFVRLADLQQICGPLVRYPAQLPPRLVVTWPSPQQWDALVARRVRL